MKFMDEYLGIFKKREEEQGGKKKNVVFFLGWLSELPVAICSGHHALTLSLLTFVVLCGHGFPSVL